MFDDLFLSVFTHGNIISLIITSAGRQSRTRVCFVCIFKPFQMVSLWESHETEMSLLTTMLLTKAINRWSKSFQSNLCVVCVLSLAPGWSNTISSSQPFCDSVQFHQLQLIFNSFSSWHWLDSKQSHRLNCINMPQAYYSLVLSLHLTPSDRELNTLHTE